MIVNYGYIQSPPDLAATSFSELKPYLGAAQIKEEHIVPEPVGMPIYQQSFLPTCVSHAAVENLEITQALCNGGIYLPLSKPFIHYNARKYDNDTMNNNGTYIHNAYQSVCEYGVCLDETFPYDLNNKNLVFIEPDIFAYKEGNDNKLLINSFYRILALNDALVNDVIHAINSNHPIELGITVGSNFQDPKGKVVGIPTDSLGGHAVLVVGYRVRADGTIEFKIRNSWGPEYNEQGYVWITSEYLKTATDLWVATSLPVIKRELDL